MAIDRYTVEEWCTKRTLKRGFTVYIRQDVSEPP